jgi:hypothetical protein
MDKNAKKPAGGKTKQQAKKQSDDEEGRIDSLLDAGSGFTQKE